MANMIEFQRWVGRKLRTKSQRLLSLVKCERAHIEPSHRNGLQASCLIRFARQSWLESVLMSQTAKREMLTGLGVPHSKAKLAALTKTAQLP
jgi:hypothetical protein